MLRPGPSVNGWSGAVARLALLLFVLRAAIPVGFMPDLAGLIEGRLQIVLCTPEGYRTIALDASGQPVDEGVPDAGALSDDCPLGLAIGAPFDIPDRIALPVASAGPDRHGERPGPFLLGPPSRGPPLGSRAPPPVLG